jgi:arsenate reductase
MRFSLRLIHKTGKPEGKSNLTPLADRSILPARAQSMNIQIFGTKKCADTRKAQRFFKERGIRFQFVDLAEKGLSKGELRSVATRVPLEQLIDRSSPRFVTKGLAHAWLDATKTESLLLEDPLLFRTPIVRNGKEATVGHCPEIWKTWQEGN